MNIRRAISADRDTLVDISLRFVRATHTFLIEADIQALFPLVRDYLTSDEPEMWVSAPLQASSWGSWGCRGAKWNRSPGAQNFKGRGAGGDWCFTPKKSTAS